MTVGDLDPFTRPAAATPIGEVEPRARAAVAGDVVRAGIVPRPAGPIFEVELPDGSGVVRVVRLVLLGRRGIAGVDVGCRLVATGTVGRCRGAVALWNPYYGLEPRGGSC